MMKKILPKVLSLCVAAAGLTGCFRSGGDIRVTEGAGQKETLVVYTSHWQEVYGPIVKEFHERSGIWVEVRGGGSIELFEEIAANESAPVCDVMFGGGADTHEAYKNHLERYESPEAAHIIRELQPEGSAWTAFSALPIVIIYNTKIVRQPPQGWSSLLMEEWRGRIAFADPDVSASAFTAFATLLLACGGDEAANMRGFIENLDGKWLSSSSDVAPNVADGQFAVGITLEEAALRHMDSGRDLAIIYPGDGTSAVPDAVSLVKNAPHRENAKLFIDFVVSRDIQQMIVSEFNRRSVRDDVKTPKNLPPLDEIELLPYDFAWSEKIRMEMPSFWKK